MCRGQICSPPCTQEHWLVKDNEARQPGADEAPALGLTHRVTTFKLYEEPLKEIFETPRNKTLVVGQQKYKWFASELIAMKVRMRT